MIEFGYSYVWTNTRLYYFLLFLPLTDNLITVLITVLHLRWRQMIIQGPGPRNEKACNVILPLIERRQT